MAALKKRWNVASGTTGAWGTITNWAPINLGRPTYRWLLSGGGTNEYYLDLIGGGDPGISAPASGGVYLDSASATSGTPGSLAAGRYGYGDNDTLGYSTIYVRTSGGVDPDTLAQEYVQLYQVPVATDHVRIPAGTGGITGIDVSTVALGDFIVEDGHNQAIGSAATPLSIDPDLFDFSGTGTCYIRSIGAIAHDVRNAGSGSTGTVGLYLILTQATVLTAFKGTVGLAFRHGELSTATTIRANGTSRVYLGKGVTTTTTYAAGSAQLYQNCGGTTINGFEQAKIRVEEVSAITNVNADGSAAFVLNGTGGITGTLTTQSTYKGLIDFTQSGEARTVNALVHKGGRVRADKGVVTFSSITYGESRPQEWAITNL